MPGRQRRDPARRPRKIIPTGDQGALFRKLIVGGDLPKDGPDHIVRGPGMQSPQREIEVVPAGGALDGGRQKTFTAHGLLRPEDHRRRTARIAGVRFHSFQGRRGATKMCVHIHSFRQTFRKFQRAAMVHGRDDNDFTARATRRRCRKCVSSSFGFRRDCSAACAASHAR